MGDSSIDNLAIVWSSISQLCAELADGDWLKATACPGWDVQDQLSHLIGPEAIFLGRPMPSAVEIPPPYVKNDVGKLNEGSVAYRRGWAPKDVLTEFDEITELRLDQLREMSDEGLDEDSWTPAGPGTYRDLLAIRVFDCWIHEQDIREAVNRPGHVEGPVADHALGRFFRAMPMIVGKKAEAANGSTVRFDIIGPTAKTLDIGVSDGRARVLEDPLDSPGVTVTAEFLPYTRVCAGRLDPQVAVKAGDLGSSGDPTLGEAIVRSLPFML
jgi:uncharacterized protein (TIGR03083 family)